MAKKASHAARLAADFLRIPTLFAGGSVALATWLLLLLGVLAPGGPLLAQQCQSEADFSYTVNGCDVEFVPSYSGPGTITSHSWIFTEDASNTSTSNIANPIHTFNGGNGLRTVLHTVSILLPNGQFISASCTKTDIAVNCQNECDFFNYNVSGCTVTFSASQSGTWDFGDGSPAVTGASVSHSYTANGTYTVKLTLQFVECTKRIRVVCGSDPEPSCCSANFTGNIIRDCGILCLRLNAYCSTGAGHIWTVSGTPCLTTSSITNMPEQSCIQLTNINTKNTKFVTVTHQYACLNGTTEVLTQNIPIPASVGEAIFIGLRQTQATKLSDFECVLPGFEYPATGGDNLPVYVSGVVRADKSSPATMNGFTFSGADVQMDPGMTGFDVPYRLRLNLYATKKLPMTMRGVADCQCLWRGNRALNGGRIETSGAVIEDAVFALRAEKGSVLGLQATQFNRNFVGIRATGGDFVLASFQANTFNGEGMLKDICTLQGLISDLLLPSLGLPFGLNPPNLDMANPIYSSVTGLAGMYLSNLNNFHLGPLAPEGQNIFKTLCYGIMSYDCNIDIESNSRFHNIFPFSYDVRRTAGILFTDRDNNGPNTLRFVGNGQDAVPPVFDKCLLGVYARSQQGIAPTSVQISDTRMQEVRCGIFLNALYKGGAFRGAAALGGFIGIQKNRILASATQTSIFVNAGIALWDQNTTVSNVEIYDNNVEINYHNIGDPTSLSGGAYGIIALGLDPLTIPLDPNAIEVDIHDNRVVVSDMAQAGIGLYSHPNGRIRNQRGGDATSGNGIFLNGSIMWGGITAALGTRSLIACNEITATAPPITLSLLQSYFQTNTSMLRNTMTGPGIGAQFRQMCDGSELRCNEMNNNTVGLSYTENAVTGPQGTESETFGNRWVGAFATGAEFIGMDPSGSQYFTRNINNENPPSVSAPLGWINPANSGATINCVLANCPAPPGLIPLSFVTRLDSFVATGGYSARAEQNWQHRHILYRKLKDDPTLLSGNSLMQSFVAAPGDNIAALWQAECASRAALTPSSALQASFANNASSINTLQTQLNATNALLSTATDSAHIAALQQQWALQDSALSVLTQANEALAIQFNAQRNAALPSVLSQLAAITPANVCETNLRRANQIYLLTSSVGLLPDSTELADLRYIGSQCRVIGGPGVSVARSLYEVFTGEILSEDCDSTANRSMVTQKSTSGLPFVVSPNPNRGDFVVTLPEAYSEKDVLLYITNAFGTEIQTIPTAQRTQIGVNLAGLPNGVYFVMLRDAGKVLTRPVLIQD